MPNRILTTITYHDEIRGRLGVGDDIVSNTDIDAPSVMTIAEAKVISNVPNYADMTDDNANYLYTATICMVAAILAPSMKSRLKKVLKDFDSTLENHVIDWNKRSIQLIDECYEFIGMIDTVSESVPIFGLAGPTRAKGRC